MQLCWNEWQWNIKTAVTAEKPVPVHNSALHKPTCTSLGSNQGLCGKRPVTDCRNHGSVCQFLMFSAKNKLYTSPGHVFKCRLWGFCCSCLSLVLYWKWRSTNCHQLLGTVEYWQYCYKCGTDDQEVSQGCQRAEITDRTTHTSRALRYESQNTGQLSSSIFTVHRTYRVISN